MKKIIYAVLFVISFTTIFSACKGDSYAEKLKKEENAVNRLIDTEGIKLIYSYPASRVFGGKEYFKDPDTGIYIHVIDSGNKDKITKGSTVFLRYYETKTLVTTPDSLYTNDKPNYDYMSLVYGNSGTYLYSSNNSYKYVFLSPACARPLDFNLGNNAEVSLIVPSASKNGSPYQTDAIEPIFYGRLKYTFIPDELDK